MINFMYMVGDVIAETFTRAVGRWQGDVHQEAMNGKLSERKALLVLFKIKKKSVRMLIHAPMNYVGVYIQKGDLRGTQYGKWECISYHDSCWRSDGVGCFLSQHQEDIHFCIFPRTEGFHVLETITDAIYVVELDDIQLGGFAQVRKEKYDRRR